MRNLSFVLPCRFPGGAPLGVNIYCLSIASQLITPSQPTLGRRSRGGASSCNTNGKHIRPNNTRYNNLCWVKLLYTIIGLDSNRLGDAGHILFHDFDMSLSKPTVEFQAAVFSTNTLFFRTLCLSLCLVEPYHQKVCIDHGSFVVERVICESPI